MNIENCQMHRQASQDSFLLNERPPDGFSWSGEETDRGHKRPPRPDNVWPDMWKNVWCIKTECEAKVGFQKYKGRVVLRGDIVKDDSGSYAVFTEHGSSASQMTAAKVMDVISRLPGCAGQAADAVPAYTQVKMEDATIVVKHSEVKISRYLDTSTQNTHGPNHGPVWKTQSFLLSEICTVILWQDYCVKGKLRKSYWSTVGRRRFRLWECIFVNWRKTTILVCVCGWNKTRWKEIEHQSDLESTDERRCFGESRHRSLTMCIWVALKREWQISKDMVDYYKSMFESRISAGAKEKLPTRASGKLEEKHYLFMVLWHGRSSCEEMCGKILRIRRIKQPSSCIKSQRRVNELARAVTKWTKACDKRLARLISYIHHTKWF